MNFSMTHDEVEWIYIYIYLYYNIHINLGLVIMGDAWVRVVIVNMNINILVWDRVWGWLAGGLEDGVFFDRVSGVTDFKQRFQHEYQSLWWGFVWYLGERLGYRL